MVDFFFLLIIIFLSKVIFTKYKFESNRYSHRFLLLLYYYIYNKFWISFDRYSHNFLLLLLYYITIILKFWNKWI